MKRGGGNLTFRAQSFHHGVATVVLQTCVEDAGSGLALADEATLGPLHSFTANFYRPGAHLAAGHLQHSYSF